MGCRRWLAVAALLVGATLAGVEARAGSGMEGCCVCSGCSGPPPCFSIAGAESCRQECSESYACDGGDLSPGVSCLTVPECGLRPASPQVPAPAAGPAALALVVAALAALGWRRAA